MHAEQNRFLFSASRCSRKLGSSSEVAYNSQRLPVNTTIQCVNSAFSPDQSVLNFCAELLHGRSAADNQPASESSFWTSKGVYETSRDHRRVRYYELDDNFSLASTVTPPLAVCCLGFCIFCLPVGSDERVVRNELFAKGI